MTRILVVDDSASMRRILEATLKAAGYEVTDAANGSEAMAAIKLTLFDLVLTDLSMPIMDGLTLIRSLRVLSAYKNVPIVVLTTEVNPDKIKQAKELGATGWVVKPFDGPQLLNAVRKILARR
jgi:two-component system, chemotaxis family, chemotaxis protein CheY